MNIKNSVYKKVKKVLLKKPQMKHERTKKKENGKKIIKVDKNGGGSRKDKYN